MPVARDDVKEFHSPTKTFPDVHHRASAGRGHFAHIAAGAVLLALAAMVPVNGYSADTPMQISVVGGLAGVSQYTRFEEPFWTREIEHLSNGRLRAEIQPFDRSGLPGPEMLQLMRLGVVPYGTALLALVSGDDPELNAVDLPALNPDMASLRKTVELYRPYLQRVLRDKYNIELLGVYTYPAQVLFCTRPFRSLNDLAGRRVRTSSVGQSEMMTALGAKPVLTPFAHIVDAVQAGSVDCAITGTLSGNEIGLSDVTSYVYAMAISWGLSFFGANEAAWHALPSELRVTLQNGIRGLQRRIWNAADRETEEGLACDTGSGACNDGHLSHMVLVPLTPEDRAARTRLLVDSVLPAWVGRCGGECAEAWNHTIGPELGIIAHGG